MDISAHHMYPCVQVITGRLHKKWTEVISGERTDWGGVSFTLHSTLFCPSGIFTTNVIFLIRKTSREYITSRAKARNFEKLSISPAHHQETVKVEMFHSCKISYSL